MNRLTVRSEQTLVDVAMSFGHLEAIKSLLYNNDIGYSELSTGQTLKYEETEVGQTRQEKAKVAYEVKPEFNFLKVHSGQSIIDLAVQRGTTEVITDLLALNEEINLYDDFTAGQVKANLLTLPIGKFLNDKNTKVNTGKGNNGNPPVESNTIHYLPQHYKINTYK